VTLRMRSIVACAVGLWLAHPLPGRAASPVAAEPARLGVAAGQTLTPGIEESANQKIASALAAQLRQSGQLQHYDIHISVQGGTAELTGQVANPAQHDEVLRIAQGIPGVARVRDLLALPGGMPVAQVQAVAPGPLLEPRPLAPPALGVPGPGGVPMEPMPVFNAPPGPPMDMNPPPLPPYAWPTYAPYNNYSRVAYPLSYPYQAFPFIGPVYPFPKIPLGWRSVKLEWRDGYWWYGKTPSGHDWWRIRYW
jgi:BON domain